MSKRNNRHGKPVTMPPEMAVKRLGEVLSAALPRSEAELLHARSVVHVRTANGRLFIAFQVGGTPEQPTFDGFLMSADNERDVESEWSRWAIMAVGDTPVVVPFDAVEEAGRTNTPVKALVHPISSAVRADLAKPLKLDVSGDYGHGKTPPKGGLS